MTRLFVYRNGGPTDPIVAVDEDGNVMGMAYNMQTCIAEAAGCFYHHRQRKATVVLMTDATKGKDLALFDAAQEKLDGLIERGEDCTLLNLYREKHP